MAADYLPGEELANQSSSEGHGCSEMKGVDWMLHVWFTSLPELPILLLLPAAECFPCAVAAAVLCQLSMVESLLGNCFLRGASLRGQHSWGCQV